MYDEVFDIARARRHHARDLLRLEEEADRDIGDDGFDLRRDPNRGASRFQAPRLAFGEAPVRR